MEFWLICLIVLVVISIFVLWTGYLKKWNRLGLVGLILVIATGTLTMAIWGVDRACESNRRNEISSITSAFEERYGELDSSYEFYEYSKYVGFRKFEDVYLVLRCKDGVTKIDIDKDTKKSIYIADDNIWLEYIDSVVEE